MSENMKGYFQGLAVASVVYVIIYVFGAWLDPNDCPCPKPSNQSSVHHGARP